MSYTPTTFADGPAGGTPITAVELNKIGTGIQNAAASSLLSAANAGAKGDGTTNDTAALTTWIGQINASTAGAYAYLPPGQYNITSALPPITQSGVTIIGAGWAQTAYTTGSVITAASGYVDTGSMLSISGEGVALKQLTVDGANRSTSLVATTGANNRFLDMSTHGAKANGVCLDIQAGAISAWVGNCRINGINYPNTGIQVNDTDCIIYASKPTNNTYNIVLLGGASGSMIVDNHMTPGATSGYNCIWVNGNPSHVSIDGNRFDNYTKSAVQIDPPSSTPNNIVITNNHFHSTVQTDATYALIGVDTTNSAVRNLQIVGNSGYASGTHRPKYGLSAQVGTDGSTPTNTSRLASLGTMFNSNSFWCSTAMQGNGAPTIARGNMLTLDGTTYAQVSDI